MVRLLPLFLFIMTCLAYGQDQGIPTQYMNDPAVDLVKNGKLLFPDEVNQLVENSKGKFDISLLNPSDSSDLWKNNFLTSLPIERLNIQEMDQVKYLSPVLSPTGIVRFNIQNPTDNKIYTLMMSKTVHSVLLAKNLLRKIGYKIPDIKYLPQVVVEFRDELEKSSFLSYIENMAFAGAAINWVREDLGTKIVLQDVVAMDSTNEIYNLAIGITSDMIQGRRVLSSLAVPLSIVNVTESVNMLRWNVGVVNNKRVMLYQENLEDFQCTWDDARWITRRIEKLSRDDWKEIVGSSYFPKPVQQILVEKIISRRNSAMKIFKIDAEEIPVDGHLNNGLELVDGKLTQQNWPGYASRFAFGDPESPLSDSDMKSWVKSRALSTVMELVLGQINQLKYLGTNIDQLNTDQYKAKMADAISQSVQNHTAAVVPVAGWIFPTYRGNLILSRNLVTGTYLGTDNLVQLVDAVGVSLSAGLHAGTMGLTIPKLISTGTLPVIASGEAGASFVRTYAHLRPVVNIKKSLTYPFKNMLVPFVKADLGHLLHEAIKVSIDPKASDDDREAAAEKALKPFKDSINIGESLLVTDSFVTSLGGEAGVNLYGKLISTSLGLNTGHVLLSRFHVHRKSEDVFHVYRDLGHKGNFGIHFNLDSLVPVLTLSLKNDAGHAKVKYFALNLSKKNPKVLSAASALRRAIVHSSTGEIEDINIKPYILKHAFTESNPSLNLFYWQFIKLNSSTDFSLTNPVGEERYFKRTYHGVTQGKNYQAYVNAVIDHWVGMLFKKNSGLSDATGMNPGYSYKGEAKTKFLMMDEEVDAKGNILEPFISLNRIWNGWSITREKAEKVLEEMRHRYKFQFYNAPVLNDSRQIYLYNISVNMMFYKEGIEHLLKLDEKRIKRIFLENQMQDSLVIDPNVPPEEENEDFNDEKYSDTGVNRFLHLLNRYKKLESKGHDDRANHKLLKALSFMEKTIYLNGIMELMGGDQNVYVTSKISGFREGDEDGDRPITSNSLGEFGSPKVLGPVIQAQRQTDMLEGEFFINWMMQRLI